jgi:hypothetical protein
VCSCNSACSNGSPLSHAWQRFLEPLQRGQGVIAHFHSMCWLKTKSSLHPRKKFHHGIPSRTQVKRNPSSSGHYVELHEEAGKELKGSNQLGTQFSITTESFNTPQNKSAGGSRDRSSHLWRASNKVGTSPHRACMAQLAAKLMSRRPTTLVQGS